MHTIYVYFPLASYDHFWLPCASQYCNLQNRPIKHGQCKWGLILWITEIAAQINEQHHGSQESHYSQSNQYYNDGNELELKSLMVEDYENGGILCPTKPNIHVVYQVLAFMTTHPRLRYFLYFLVSDVKQH